MIATERFVFIHLHTCAVRFGSELLLRFVPGARRIGDHLPRRLTPPSLADLPAIGFVRNPWSYYALWYSRNMGKASSGPLFRTVSANGTLDFARTLGNLLELGVQNERLDALLREMPHGFQAGGLNLPGFALQNLRGSGLGFFSFVYRHAYDGPGILHLRRVERLRDELIPTLVALGQPVSDAMRAFVADATAPDTGQAVDYTSLYSNALRDLVAERDAIVIGRHGYRFGA